MATALERQCTLLIHHDGPSEDGSTLKQQLESSDLDKKRDALRQVIKLQLNGEVIPGMLMMVIRYVLPHEDTHLRKMGLYFLEVVDKHGPDGKMLPEMILACNMIMKELTHPNEYTRGCALRFVCKIHDHEILEPLITSIRQNLEHRHSFVRRNAILAMHTIYNKFEFLVPDAPELVEEFLRQESDLACKRNAFVMLCQADQERAVNYLNENINYVASWEETMQLAALELVRRVCRANPMEKGQYIKIIFALLNSPSAAVIYESANTLISLSSAPTAIRAAAQSYCQLLASESDNNIKLILLDRITDLRNNQLGILQEMVMDIVRALNSPNYDIRKKTLGLVMDSLTSRNVDEVIAMLKKEVMKTQADATSDSESQSKYRQLLIQSIHSAALRFPAIASSALHVLTDFLNDNYGDAAVNVISFVRETAETLPELRPVVLSKVLDAIPSIRNPQVVRGALWILGTYAEQPKDVKEAFEIVLEGIGSLPLSLKPKNEEIDENESGGNNTASPTKASGKPVVLADGTYASQTASSETASAPKVNNLLDDDKYGPPIRALMLKGEWAVSVAACTMLTKLVLRLAAMDNAPPKLVHKMTAKAMLVCASLLKFGRSSEAPVRIDDCSAERIVSCIHAMAKKEGRETWLDGSREAFSEVIREKQKKKEKAAELKARKDQTPIEEVVDFRLLRSQRRAAVANGDADVDEIALMSAATGSEKNAGFDLSRVVQLTGMSDPVYAEAHIAFHQYDIILDVLVVNRTTDTLQNLNLELATMGDLRLCERPQSYTLGPESKRTIRASVKVSSTETGVIFGNIVYDVAGKSNEGGCVILNDIHVDIMNYIKPGEVSDAAFRSMWAEFEWENKVAVNTTYTDLGEFLDFVIQNTNMKCLTLRGIEKTSGYLAANLYARSVFGEDALINLSVEKASDKSLQGHIRIRSKTQGIALSLGDRITLKQTQKKGS